MFLVSSPLSLNFVHLVQLLHGTQLSPGANRERSLARAGPTAAAASSASTSSAEGLMKRAMILVGELRISRGEGTMDMGGRGTGEGVEEGIG